MRAWTLRAFIALTATPCAGVLLGAGGFVATAIRAPALCSAATYSSHVTLVVEHGDGRVIPLCIGFDGSSISGEQILQASGLEYGTANYGSLGDAVCQIDYEPASYPPGCFSSSSPYWQVFDSRGGGAWASADKGVSNESFADGDAEGFRYDAQGSGAAPASPAGVCAAALRGNAALTPPPDTVPPPHGSPAPIATGAPRASPAATSSSGATASAPTPSPSATIAAGVVGPPANVGSPRTAQGQGINAGVLIACIVGGALIGLLAVQVVRRRRA